MRISYFRCPLDFLRAGVGLCKSNIIKNRIVEQDRLLVDRANQRTQRLLFQVAYVDAIEQNSAAGNIHKTRYKIHQSRLPSSRWTNQSHRLSFRYVQVDLAKYTFVAVG